MANGETYEQFVDKFKPKKTTDDCYTPPEIFEAVLEWASNEYGFDYNKILRPFYPGGDYESEEYPEDYIVVDNPPFSIITPIVRWYIAHNVKFFLFCPALICCDIASDIKACRIIIKDSITYHNGAKVATAFITNLDTENVIRTAPELNEKIRMINSKTMRKLPKYQYPKNVLMASTLKNCAGQDIKIKHSEACFVRRLDSQVKTKRVLFGGGYLISDEAAQSVHDAQSVQDAQESAIVFELSNREREIVSKLKG